MAKVYNFYRDGRVKDSVDIRRPGPWGNPFVIGVDGDRAHCLAEFEIFARNSLALNSRWLDPLIGKNLLCVCAPKACHGDIIIRMCEEIQ